MVPGEDMLHLVPFRIVFAVSIAPQPSWPWCITATGGMAMRLASAVRRPLDLRHGAWRNRGSVDRPRGPTGTILGGLYFGGGVGWADISIPGRSFTMEGIDFSNITASEDNAGYRLFTGYWINKHVGIEVGRTCSAPFGRPSIIRLTPLRRSGEGEMKSHALRQSPQPEYRRGCRSGARFRHGRHPALEVGVRHALLSARGGDAEPDPSEVGDQCHLWDWRILEHQRQLAHPGRCRR